MLDVVNTAQQHADDEAENRKDTTHSHKTQFQREHDREHENVGYGTGCITLHLSTP